jgi:hypothetical protein
VCVVTFNSSSYYAYPAVCGTTTLTTTTGTTTTTTTTSTTSYYTRVTTVISKTILGAQFPGLEVYVDRRYYATPFSLPLQGMHTFIAPSTVTIDGLTYSFLRWEDEWGRVLSAGRSMTSYTLGRTFYVVYQPPSYTLRVYVKDARTGRPVAGASVYLDSDIAGTTDSRGVVVIQKVLAGWHHLGVTKYAGYLPYWATVFISASTLTAYLTPL